MAKRIFKFEGMFIPYRINNAKDEPIGWLLTLRPANDGTEPKDCLRLLAVVLTYKKLSGPAVLTLRDRIAEELQAPALKSNKVNPTPDIDRSGYSTMQISLRLYVGDPYLFYGFDGEFTKQT